MYADDAVYAVAGQPELRGKAAIEAMEVQGLRSSDVGEVAHLSLALRVDGAVAHELGTIQGDVTLVGGTLRHVVFHFLAAWRRDAQGVWRIAHLVGHMQDAAEGTP
jgi:ketosteroid isomerase-like protein